MSILLPSTRIARSSPGQRLDDVPWEMLERIFSFCDQATLLALSLVSFACWQLAGPILYEEVEITDLDALATLFFIKVTPSSSRLAEATSLLSRIRTLTLDITSYAQARRPRFKFPFYVKDIEDELEHIRLRTPHRLRAHTPSPLLLKSLIVPISPEGVDTYLPWMAIQILPHLNPVQVIHRSIYGPPYLLSGSGEDDGPVSHAFLEQWTALRRVEQIGCLLATHWGEAWTEHGLYSFWRPSNRALGRTLELVFASTFVGPSSWRGGSNRAQRFRLFVRKGGVVEELAGAVDLRVVIRADGAKEEKEVVEVDVPSLPEWMRKLVAVEVGSS